MDKIIDAQFLQLKYNGAKVGAEDLRVSVVLHLVLVSFLGVESEALARLRPSSTAGPLLCTGFGDGGHQQRLHSDTRVVYLHEEGPR